MSSKLTALSSQLTAHSSQLAAWRVKLVGLNPKRSFITPLDFVPGVGPLLKINKGRKVLLASKGKLLWLGAAIYGDYLLLKEGYRYLSRSKGSGAPLRTSPTAPTKAISRSSSTGGACPRGMRWDRKKGKCVRINRR